MSRTIPLLVLLSGCGLFGDGGQIRKDANHYRVELNQLSRRIDEYGQAAAAACGYAHRVPALRAPCRHLSDLDAAVRISWRVAWRAIDVAEETGLVVDEGVRVVSRVRRLVDEIGEAVRYVGEVVENELDSDGVDKVGADGGGSPRATPAPENADPPEGAPESSGAEPAPANGAAEADGR